MNNVRLSHRNEHRSKAKKNYFVYIEKKRLTIYELHLLDKQTYLFSTTLRLKIANILPVQKRYGQ